MINMGEAKRRKLLDPTWGDPELYVEVKEAVPFEDLSLSIKERILNDVAECNKRIESLSQEEIAEIEEDNLEVEFVYPVLEIETAEFYPFSIISNRKKRMNVASFEDAGVAYVNKSPRAIAFSIWGDNKEFTGDERFLVRCSFLDDDLLTLPR